MNDVMETAFAIGINIRMNTIAAEPNLTCVCFLSVPFEEIDY